MNKPLLTAFLLWSVLASSLLPIEAAQIARGGSDYSTFVILIQGTVEVAPAGTDNWAPAKLNQKLSVGDKLRTGKLSRATLRSTAAGDVPVREASVMTIA